MNKTNGIALLCVALLMFGHLSFGIGVDGAPVPNRPNIVICISENKSLVPEDAGQAEQVVAAELRNLGYNVLPAVGVPRLSLVCPADVAGVWNADRRRVFQHYFPNADMLWMAGIDYELADSPQGGMAGKATILARVFNARTGGSIWFARVPTFSFHGTDAGDAVRNALGQAMPKLVADFQKLMAANRVLENWTPGAIPPVAPAPQLLPPGPGTGPAPLPGATAVEQPDVQRGNPPPSGRERSPYTGIIVDAQDFPIQPSYRSHLYSPEGPISLPQGRRMTWSDPKHAREMVGERPLRMRPQRTEGDRIILHPNDARRLQQESIRTQGPVTVIVRPPQSAGAPRQRIVGPRPRE